jgi:hypothetical protein
LTFANTCYIKVHKDDVPFLMKWNIVLNDNLCISKMEYATKISDDICDSNYMRFVGYKEDNPCIRKYFDISTVRTISKKVTELLQGVDPQNRPIIVPDNTICSVMSEIYNSFRPATGDIYSRYIVPSGSSTESYVQVMIDQVIEVITSNVRNSLEMDENNRKLSIWTTVYGDFNEHGLRQYAPIKTLVKRPHTFQFNMNY